MQKRGLTVVVVTSTLCVAAGVAFIALQSPGVELVGLAPVSEVQAIALVQRRGGEQVTLTSVGVGPSWSVDLTEDEAPASASVYHGMSAARGVVVVRSKSARFLHAWRTEDGARVWTAELEPGEGQTPSRAIYGDASRVLTWSGEESLHAFARSTGERVWSAKFEEGVKEWALGTRVVVVQHEGAVSVIDRQRGVRTGRFDASGPVCFRPGVLFGFVDGAIVEVDERMVNPPKVAVAQQKLAGLKRMIACGFRGDEDLVITGYDGDEDVVLIRASPSRGEVLWRVVLEQGAGVADAADEMWPSSSVLTGSLGRTVPVGVRLVEGAGVSVAMVDTESGEVARRFHMQGDGGSFGFVRLGPMHYGYDWAGGARRVWALDAQSGSLMGVVRAPGLVFGPTALRGRALWMFQEKRSSSVRALRWLALDPRTLDVRAAGNEGSRAALADALPARDDGGEAAP
ncbi:MAG: PQQ-binding-like beta-propeller repeat protein [Myxococcota bacterium]